jgi:hypothetical protein
MTLTIKPRTTYVARCDGCQRLLQPDWQDSPIYFTADELMSDADACGWFIGFREQTALCLACRPEDTAL